MHIGYEGEKMKPTNENRWKKKRVLEEIESDIDYIMDAKSEEEAAQRLLSAYETGMSVAEIELEIEWQEPIFI